MVVHSLLTGGDNTWQDILFHNTPSYITSTIILSHKSNMKLNMIIFLHQSVSQVIDRRNSPLALTRRPNVSRKIGKNPLISVDYAFQT